MQRLISSVQVNESLLAMSFENEGKEEEDEDESDTLNDSDNIDSQHNGGSNNGKADWLPIQITLNTNALIFRSSL